MIAGLSLASLVVAAPPGTPTDHEGTLAGGATWIAHVSAAWNGTIILYSRGASATVAKDTPGPAT